MDQGMALAVPLSEIESYCRIVGIPLGTEEAQELVRFVIAMDDTYMAEQRRRIDMAKEANRKK